MDSPNEFVKKELEKYEKWNNFITFYIDPIKQRFKEGLLAPTNNELTNNTFGNFEKNFMDFKSFDQQEKEIEEKSQQQPEQQRKIPMREFYKVSSQEYFNGKKIEVVVNEKKEETMEILQEEEEDHFMGENIHTHVISYNEKPHIENHEFYDNNYWKPGFIVDEVALLELTLT